MKNFFSTGVALVAIVIAGYALLHQAPPAQTPSFGGVTNYDNIALTKVGTSTLSNVGCFNGFATSTVTPIKFVYGIVGTTSIAGASNGYVLWQYGQCGSNPGL